MKYQLVLVLWLSLLNFSICEEKEEKSEVNEEFYNLVANDINGNPYDFNQLRGKIVAIVNVASNCGFTDPQYKMLVKLHHGINKKGNDFEILAFPCDQFLNQEPGSNEEIKVGQNTVSYL